MRGHSGEIGAEPAYDRLRIDFQWSGLGVAAGFTREHDMADRRNRAAQGAASRHNTLMCRLGAQLFGVAADIVDHFGREVGRRIPNIGKVGVFIVFRGHS